MFRDVPTGSLRAMSRVKASVTYPRSRDRTAESQVPRSSAPATFWLMKPAPWKLYFVTDPTAFECDYVIARTATHAKRLFSEEYGGLDGDAELVITIEKAPDWLTEACWLGPDPDLTELGGERLTSMDFPRWKFGAKVVGPPTSLAERYGKPEPSPTS